MTSTFQQNKTMSKYYYYRWKTRKIIKTIITIALVTAIFAYSGILSAIVDKIL